MQAGIQGAAWATGISYGCIFLILLPHFMSSRTSLLLQFGSKGWNELYFACANGLSEFTNELSAGVVVLMFNWVMITRLGVVGVAAFTIVKYMLFFAMMIAFGLSESLQPTISKNLGARQTGKIGGFVVIASLSWIVVGVFFCSLLVFFPKVMILIFLKDSETHAMAIAQDYIRYFYSMG